MDSGCRMWGEREEVVAHIFLEFKKLQDRRNIRIMIRSHCHIGAALEFMQEEYNFMVTENWYSHKIKKIA